MGQSAVVHQPKLFEHGIQVERSDIRAHVAPGTHLIFVFQTSSILGVDLSKYREASAGQPGVRYRTSTGRLVPPDDIPGIRIFNGGSDAWWKSFNEKDTTSNKGKAAVAVVERMLRAGRFPLWPSVVKESMRLEVQHGGTDILLHGVWRIQVKCDFWAGPKDKGGTGSLYIETAELNPLKRF